jgi:hypothetical protein
MRITFRRFPDHARAYSVIERDDGVVYQLRGFSLGGTELPHDLRHFIVERELEIADGIWGGIAAGIVYTSMEHVRGRRPPHAAERSADLKRTQRGRLMRAELLANLVEAVAVLADPSETEIARLARQKLSVIPLAEPGADPAAVIALPPPAALGRAARALQVEAARWARLRPGEELVYEWLRTRPAPGVPRSRPLVPRPRAADDRADPRHSGRRGPR